MSPRRWRRDGDSGKDGRGRPTPILTDADRRIREVVDALPPTPRRHVQEIDGDWLPCWRDYRRIPLGAEKLVAIQVSETTGEHTVVALCRECFNGWKRADW